MVAVPQFAAEEQPRRYRGSTRRISTGPSKRRHRSGPQRTTTIPNKPQNGVRNVQSTAKTTKKPHEKKTIDESFNETYSKAGLQPHSLDDPSSSDTEKGSAANTPKSSQHIRQLATASPTTEMAPVAPPRSNIQTTTRSTKTPGREKVSLADRKRVRAVSLLLKSFTLTFWGFIQLPCVLLSYVFLIIGATAHSLRAAIVPKENTDGLWEAMINGSLETFDTIAKAGEAIVSFVNDSIKSTFGYDLAAALAPTTWYVAFAGIAMIFAYAFLLIVYISFKTAGFEPLGGRRSGHKHTLLLLCLIGYFLPLLNLVPWAYFWIKAVRRHPK